MADKEERDKTIAEDLVVTKYKMAGDIVNKVLKQVLARCIEGASVRDICVYGDELILDETMKVFKRGKDFKKGIAFPTCVSVNNCISHFSPLLSDPDYILQKEDVVKAHLGAHIDGFVAVAAHTVVLGGSETNTVKGKKADVVTAAHFGTEVAVRLLKPGNDSRTIIDAVHKVAEAFQCKSLEGVTCHKLKRFSIYGEKTAEDPEEPDIEEDEPVEFETYGVYVIDVVISTGEGVSREEGSRPSIYKKTDEMYQLKLKASRMFYSEVVNKYDTMPFNLRYFQDEKKAKLAVQECVKHNLIQPFPVLYEKPNEFVVQFTFTALLMPNAAHKITGLQFEGNVYHSERTIVDPELKAFLCLSANPRAIKRQKKKMCKAGEEACKEVGVPVYQ